MKSWVVRISSAARDRVWHRSEGRPHLVLTGPSYRAPWIASRMIPAINQSGALLSLFALTLSGRFLPPLFFLLHLFHIVC